MVICDSHKLKLLWKLDKDERSTGKMTQRKGGRRFDSIEDCVDSTIQELEQYTKKNEDGVQQPVTAIAR